MTDRKYAVALSENGLGLRYLTGDLAFDSNIDEAAIFDTTTQALQAIHSRGMMAERKGWPTGRGKLAIVIVEETLRPRRVYVGRFA